MKASKRWLWAGLVCATAAILAWWAFVQPEVRFRQIVMKYPVGTEAETVLRDFGARAVLHRSDNFPGPDTTEPEKDRWAAYYVELPQMNAHLIFNYHRKLIRAIKYSDSRKPQ